MSYQSYEYNVEDIFGINVGSGYPESTGIYDWMGEVYGTPGIMQSPYAFPNGLGAFEVGLADANPGGAGLVNQANEIWGYGNGISSLFPAYDTDQLLQASSQGSIDNMLNGMGLGGYGTYTDYNSLVQDSYYSYNQGVDIYEQFDPSNAYINDDAYYYGTMGYANDVFSWAESF